MELFTGKKVGVTNEEKALPYYKFFERDMAKIPENKLALVDSSSTVEGVPFEQKDLFLIGDDKDFCQLGYGVATNGTGFVCNETYMPGVTSEMLDWWFAWQGVGSDLRYKIWDPEDHYFSRSDDVKRMCNAGIPMNQRIWGIMNYVLEDIGTGPMLMRLQFKRPRDLGFDESLIGGEKCQSLAAGIIDDDLSVVMVHKWYPHDGGVMFCSHFWIGYGFIDGKIVRKLPKGEKIPIEFPKYLFSHNIKEYTNLAAILPEVYAQNKDNF
ncbi:MAG: phloretin hydrolase [Selenomonadaceae bacterium]|nr:phloretin hydrolase [Selenomonadaceae bacterium]MBR3368928.1 phloretin hydrolase [Candidatus Saccharibacteria bacterium]